MGLGLGGWGWGRGCAGAHHRHSRAWRRGAPLLAGAMPCTGAVPVASAQLRSRTAALPGACTQGVQQPMATLRVRSGTVWISGWKSQVASSELLGYTPEMITAQVGSQG
jgi:hypothetical protein